MKTQEVYGLIAILFYVLVLTLKLFGVGEPATWSWWLVLSPFWVMGAVSTVLWVVIIVGGGFLWLAKRPIPPRTYGQETNFVGLARHREFMSGKITAEEFRRSSVEPVVTPLRMWERKTKD